jgi:hypothetical protein
LKVGDWVDARDTVNKWCVGQVLSISDRTVRIHYKGWSAQYDDDLPKDSPRLAELGKHTSGKDTGWGNRKQGTVWNVSAADIAEVRRKIELHVSGDEPDDRFWKGVRLI